MLVYSLIFLHTTINIIALYFLIADGSRPIRIWAWILVILFLPLLGATLYYFFGVNLRKRKIFNLKKVIDYNQFEEFISTHGKKIEQEIEDRKGITSTYLNLIKLLAKTNGSLLTFNNKVKILSDGPETFETIFEACRRAKEYIHLQYYIFLDGELADQFYDIFSTKIKEGVAIRLIYDHLGSWEISHDFLRRLKEIGVKVYPFMPVKFGALAKVNYRNHRKILIVDGKVGFTGGINVDDKYIHDDPRLGHWTDTHIRIEGMSVNFLHFIFLCDWQFVSEENLIDASVFSFMRPIATTPVQIVSSGPDTDYSNILQQYLYILYQANKYVYIVNPYIVPDVTLRAAIKTVALSGIEVRMIVPEKSESSIIHWTVRSFFSEFLQAGVQIFLYKKGFVHSKIILSDDSVCSVGTANLDIRSFEQNFEVNALIYEKNTTMQLKSQFYSFLSDSDQLYPVNYSKRPTIHKVKEKLARLTSPLM